MKILETALLGIVQALAEFLPISSSGLTQSLSCLFSFNSVSAEFVSAFLHIPTLIVLIIIFRKTLYELLQELLSCFKEIFKGKFKISQITESREFLFSVMTSTIVLLIFAPLGTSGTFKSVKPESLLMINGIGFLICGFVIFLVHSGLLDVKRGKNIGFLCAALIGFVQGVSLILPGFSRLGSALAVSTLFGVPKQKAVKYSFVIGVPAMILNILACFSILQKATDSVSIGALLIGFIICLGAGFFASKLISLLFNDKGFKAFGYINSIIGLILTVAGAVLSFRA